MKKRLLSMILLLCMVLTMLPTAVFAEDALPEDQEASELQGPQEEPAPQSADEGIAVQAAHTHCYCGGSVIAGDHRSHADVTYTAWNVRNSIPYDSNQTAYIYLEDDITLNSNLSIQLGATLYLCLNGHTLNLGQNMIWAGSEGAKLYLCDCSVQKTGAVSGGSNGCISVDDAFDYNATFNMYGGTLRGGNRTGTGGGVDI